MIVFQIGAGGMNASGMAVVVAETPEHATLLANLESRERAKDVNNKDYDLTYHEMNAKVVHGVYGTPKVKHPHSRASVRAHVVVLHEFGFPEFPSTGSGIKHTF